MLSVGCGTTRPQAMAPICPLPRAPPLLASSGKLGAWQWRSAGPCGNELLRGRPCTQWVFLWPASDVVLLPCSCVLVVGCASSALACAATIGFCPLCACCPASQPRTAGRGCAATYPSSHKAKKDWDKVEAEVKVRSAACKCTHAYGTHTVVPAQSQARGARAANLLVCWKLLVLLRVRAQPSLLRVVPACRSWSRRASWKTATRSTTSSRRFSPRCEERSAAHEPACAPIASHSSIGHCSVRPPPMPRGRGLLQPAGGQGCPWGRAALHGVGRASRSARAARLGAG